MLNNLSARSEGKTDSESAVPIKSTEKRKTSENIGPKNEIQPKSFRSNERMVIRMFIFAAYKENDLIQI